MEMSAKEASGKTGLFELMALNSGYPLESPRELIRASDKHKCKGDGGWLPDGDRVSFRGDENIVELR